MKDELNPNVVGNSGLSTVLGVTIRKDVPVPQNSYDNRSREIPQILSKMEVGDFVFFPESDTRFKRDKAYTYGARNDRKFLVQKYQEKNPETGELVFGLGVWRTA